jgi:hypothetical protein
MNKKLSLKGINPREVMYVANALKMLEAQKHDPSAGDPTPGIADAGGIFSYPYARGDVINAVQAPTSVTDILPFRKSRIRNDIVEVMTSMGLPTGENPTSVCGVPMTAGQFGICRTKTQFGKMFMKTDKIDITEVGLLDSWGVKPRTMVGGVSLDSPWVPDRLRRRNVDLTSPAAAALWKAGMEAKRATARIEIVGDISLANTATRPFWIKEFNGLDNLLIDIVDADTGDPCPAASPEIIAWDAAVDAEVGGESIVNALHTLYYTRVDIASEVGMDTVTFAFAMDRRLFYRIVQVFACTYAFARCGDFDAGTPGSRTLAEIENRRNEMFRGRYLLIDGTPVPVVFTSGFEVDSTANPTLDSSIYLIPLRTGARPLTYIEFNPYDAPQVQEAITEFGMSRDRVRVTNDGLFIFSNRDDGFCIELLLAMQPRLMMDARFLAGRIDGVEYQTYAGYRNWNPAGSDYYGGGETAWDSGLNA